MRFTGRHSGKRSKPESTLYGYASRQATRFINHLKMTEHLMMLVLAIIIGTLAGFGAVGIRALIKEISFFSFPGEGSILDNIAATPWYLKLLVPTVGGLIIGPIIHNFAREARGTGVPEVMQSVLLKSGQIRPRVALIKTIVSTICIGTGGSVGREGPIVQIGSSLGSTVAQFFHIPATRMKTLVGCGAAAGIAAAFNAPVAGAMFAIEIILMDYAVASFSPIIIASVMATVISHAFEGDFPAMVVLGEHSLHSLWEVNFYLILGVLCGVVSWIFIKLVFDGSDFWERHVHVRPYLKAGLGGLVVGGIAILFPQIMGVGYDSINLALNHQSMTYMGAGAGWVNELLGSHTFWVMTLALVFIKILATSMTLGSGGSGGIFAPSLFVGAMLGGFFGHFVHGLFPAISASPGTYAFIAMGGLVAGTTRAPITAIITVFEITKETSIILPLMVTCIISTIVSQKFTRESIYTLKLLRRNINVKNPAHFDILKTLCVSDVYKQTFVSIPENTRFRDVVDAIISNGLPYVSVHEMDSGRFLGKIGIDTIKDLMFDPGILHDMCIAGDIANRDIPTVTTEDHCDDAIRKMRSARIDALPVVDVRDDRMQIGIVWMQNIVDAYANEIEHLDIASDLANKIMMTNIDHDIRFLEGYMMSEVPAPAAFVGQSIRDLQIRAKFGVDILSIKSTSRNRHVTTAIPAADHVFAEGDVLIVAGKADSIMMLKNLP